MKIHEKYIRRCLELAKFGLGTTSPNPMVGCVIVHDDKIIGEGYTSVYGGNHAEVNAIRAVKDPSLLKDAALYVSLEPCNHFGKTPPCSDLIVKSGIKNVVVGCVDPFEKVAGKGIEKLKAHGCDVSVGILERACLEMNKRFLTFHAKERPYIILKWAETQDGFIDINRDVHSKNQAKPNWITNQYSRQLVHKWRVEEDAILVGTNTVLKDNPKLNSRHWKGKNPVRVVLDRNLRVPTTYHIYNGEQKTIILTERESPSAENLFFEQLDFSKNLVRQICHVLYKHKLLSVIIEGGQQTLQAFIDAKVWDEARIFTGIDFFLDGISAPDITGKLISETEVQGDRLKTLISDL
ncbi:MAG: bifunctional diaminohydroxyphosphoribosylaminopyrimidine deaminase/5-amino-6-(5-phosphoribosylamino)uracil reductase RibD [Flavobacteriaceae bacterium]|nr:bifunctional diaminohydroxyphosphoribosylaminopyrimidine deaminase/5-amino-6-(5-phosphoribosylamino)uracil reductase RibD [Flavobacteriaceae bacterium]